jgi:hypothetical protein
MLPRRSRFQPPLPLGCGANATISLGEAPTSCNTPASQRQNDRMLTRAIGCLKKELNCPSLKSGANSNYDGLHLVDAGTILELIQP